ncbi:hypothetical protein TeGR_g12255 [Tetraparma gracilis]|uniref:EF-hand domain-containing protein n=1 Tax=Tetraparma gracilis TaxID=2962635 RepID=A0ABQ6M980_9STRA|nr:hypothetical protein TeGR_g12255 [Tetraparma gracilis]
MSFLIRLPFRITTWSIQLTEALCTSTPVVFSVGCILGWLAHQRYGDALIAGVSGDAAALWKELDSDGDGKVSFREFEQAMRSRMGSLCPSSSTLKITYEGLLRVQEEAKNIDVEALKKKIEQGFK